MEDLYQNVVKSSYEPISSHYSQNLKLLMDNLLEKTPIKRPSTDYLLENIERVIPDNFHSNPILKQLIKKYSRKNKKGNIDNDINRVY